MDGMFAMEQKIVECVPNFSEGKDLAKIKQITAVIEAVPGITLLNIDPGTDINRTVVTFVGSPEAVAEAAFQAIAKAAQVIDMTKHHGAHPRIGATDVVPFVPVEGVTLEDCAKIARQVGERVGRELEIPVYLYEEAATRPERRNLANIRKGEYEGLEEKLKDPAWIPDFGPVKFNARSGATVIGAREFLIAYNVTLNTRDKELAADIASELREKGRVARAKTSSPHHAKGKILHYAENSFPCGNCEFIGRTFAETNRHISEVHGYDLRELLLANDIDPNNVIGQRVYHAGKFKFCKAIGWYVDEYKRAQVSINLTNYRVTPPHLVLEEVRKLAAERGLVVTGSEVVGLIPFQALVEAGKFYLKRQGKSPHVPVPDILESAVYSMGLRDVQPFDIRKKVIGLPREFEKGLTKLSVKDFVDEVSRDTPAPGGGSIAALAGSLGAALASMVANITIGKPDSEGKGDLLLNVAEKAQKIKDQLILAVDEDTNAFNAYMEARGLPATTAEERAFRHHKMQEGLKVAASVPYRSALASYEAMQLAEQVAIHGSQNSITDAAVGLSVAFTGVRGGIWNVMVNLKDIADKAFVQEMQKECRQLLKKAEELLERGSRYTDNNLAGNLEQG
mgnify:FL=1